MLTKPAIYYIHFVRRLISTLLSVETPRIALRQNVRMERNMKTKIGIINRPDKGPSYNFMYCKNSIAANHQPEKKNQEVQIEWIRIGNKSKLLRSIMNSQATEHTLSIQASVYPTTAPTPIGKMQNLKTIRHFSTEH